MTFLPPPTPDAGCPPAYGGCRCDCHVQAGVMHFVPCCYPNGWHTMMVGKICHVIPTNDLRNHEASIRCWCKPTRDVECDELWSHNSMDRREEYEKGRKLS